MKITKDKKHDLERELKDRIDNSRPEIKKEMIAAAEQGDFFRENFPFQDASERMQKNEDRIKEIEDILENANIIDDKLTGSIQIGSNFEISSENTVKQLQLVNSIEADPRNGKISIQSPIGKKVLGLNDGDTFELNGKSFLINLK